MRSTYLFARPRWAEGAARVMDLGATMRNYNHAPTTQAAEAIAMYLDWACVGDDLRAALSTYIGGLDDETLEEIHGVLASRTHADAT